MSGKIKGNIDILSCFKTLHMIETFAYRYKEEFIFAIDN